MTATIVGPGGSVEIRNDVGSPISVSFAGPVEVTNELGPPIGVSFTDAVEVKNDAGSPITVNDGTLGELTHVVETVTAAGDTPIHAPAAGKAVRLKRIQATSDPDSTNSPLIDVLLGAEQKYRGYALAFRQQVTGPVNGALIIRLDGAGSVAVTALLEEV